MTTAEQKYRALLTWQTASRHLIDAIPPWAGVVTRERFPEAKTLRCFGDIGEESNERLRPVAVLDAAGNILADDDEHQTETWDKLCDELMDLDYLPMLDGDYLSHAEIDCDTGELTLVSTEDWKART